MHSVAALRHEEVREALRLLGAAEPPAHRGTAARLLRETLTAYGTVRAVLDEAPEGAREAFVRLAHDGPAPVDELLGRGWWGHGALPPPLDWLQRRALVLVGDDGQVHAVEEAVAGFRDLALELPADEGHPPSDALHVEAAATVVVAPRPAALDRALTVPGAGLRAVAPTVAVSRKAPAAVSAALRAGGVRLDEAVVAAPTGPTTGTGGTSPLPEDAVGPRAVRGLLERAVAEGRQVRLEYFASSRGGAETERVVDPWSFQDDLLRGYCHLREGERTFAVDRIGRARLLLSDVEHTPE